MMSDSIIGDGAQLKALNSDLRALVHTLADLHREMDALPAHKTVEIEARRSELETQASATRTTLNRKTAKDPEQRALANAELAAANPNVQPLGRAAKRELAAANEGAAAAEGRAKTGRARATAEKTNASSVEGAQKKQTAAERATARENEKQARYAAERANAERANAENAVRAKGMYKMDDKWYRKTQHGLTESTNPVRNQEADDAVVAAAQRAEATAARRKEAAATASANAAAKRAAKEQADADKVAAELKRAEEKRVAAEKRAAEKAEVAARRVATKAEADQRRADLASAREDRAAEAAANRAKKQADGDAEIARRRSLAQRAVDENVKRVDGMYQMDGKWYRNTQHGLVESQNPKRNAEADSAQQMSPFWHGLTRGKGIDGLIGSFGDFTRYAVVGAAIGGVTLAAAAGMRQMQDYADSVANLAVALSGLDGNYQKTESTLSSFTGSLMESSRLTGQNVAVSMDNAARGVFALAPSGSKAQKEQVGRSFADQSNILSAITNQPSGEAATTMIAVAKAYDLTADSLGSYSDAVAQAALITGAKGAEISSGMAAYAEVAKISGFTADQAATAIATLNARLGKSGQAAAQSLNAITSILSGSSGKSVVASINQMLPKSDEIDKNAAAMDQLQQIFKVWDRLDGSTQQLISNKLGGRAQLEDLMALKGNAGAIWGANAEKSAGAAEKQLDKISHNIAMDIKKITSDVENMFNSLQDSGALDIIGLAVKTTEELTHTVSVLMKGYNDVFSGFGDAGSKVRHLVTNITMLTAAILLLRKASMGSGAGVAGAAEGAAAEAAAGGLTRGKIAAGARRLVTPVGFADRQFGAGLGSKVGAGAVGAKDALTGAALFPVETATAFKAKGISAAKAFGSGFLGFMQSPLGIAAIVAGFAVLDTNIYNKSHALGEAYAKGIDMSGGGVKTNRADGLAGAENANEKRSAALTAQAEKIKQARSGILGHYVDFMQGGKNKDEQDALTREADYYAELAKKLKAARATATVNGDLASYIDPSSKESVQQSLTSMADAGQSATTQLAALMAALDKVAASADGASSALRTPGEITAAGDNIDKNLRSNINGQISDLQNNRGNFQHDKGARVGWFGMDVVQSKETNSKQADLVKEFLKGKKWRSDVEKVYTDALASNKDLSGNAKEVGTLNVDDKQALDAKAKGIIAQAMRKKSKNFRPEVIDAIAKQAVEASGQGLTDAFGVPWEQNQKTKKPVTSAMQMTQYSNRIAFILDGIAQTTGQAATEAALDATKNGDKRGAGVAGAAVAKDTYAKALSTAKALFDKQQDIVVDAGAKRDALQAQYDAAAPGKGKDALKKKLDKANTNVQALADTLKANDSKLEAARVLAAQADQAYLDSQVAHADALAGLAQARIGSTNSVAVLNSQIAQTKADIASYAGNEDKLIPLYTQLANLNEQKKQALRGARKGERALAIDPRDSQAQARAAVSEARREIARLLRDGNAWGSPEVVAARQALQAANVGALEADLAYADAVANAKVFPGSAVQASRAQLNSARRKMASYAKGTTEWWQAYAEVQSARQALSQAELDAANNTRLLGLDMTNPVQMARNAYKAALDKLRSDRSAGAPSDVLNADRVASEQAQWSAQGAAFSQRMSDAQTAESLGRMSHASYMRYLQAEHNRLATRLKGMNKMDQGYRQLTDQLNQVDQAMKSALDAMSGQWNLGSIDVPTPFEARQMAQLRGAGSGVTNDNRVVYVNTTLDRNAIVSLLREEFGVAAQQRAGMTTRKAP